MTPFLKQRLRNIAHTLGIQARFVRPVRRDMGSFCKHLRLLGFKPQTVIDVGVADGTIDLYAPFPDAHFMLVEPIEEFRPAIENLLARYKGEAHFVAAGSANDMVRFSAGDEHADLHNARLGGEGNGREVPMRRLDDLAAGKPGPILLKIDVEGFELDVIEGATGILPQVEVAILETRLFDLLGGTSILHEVVGAMAERGYVVYDILSMLARPLDDALVLCDLVFVRADSALRGDLRWSTPEQSRRYENGLVARLRRLAGT